MGCPLLSPPPSGTNTGFFSREGKWDAQTMHFSFFCRCHQKCLKRFSPPRINPCPYIYPSSSSPPLPSSFFSPPLFLLSSPPLPSSFFSPPLFLLSSPPLPSSFFSPPLFLLSSPPLPSSFFSPPLFLLPSPPLPSSFFSPPLFLLSSLPLPSSFFSPPLFLLSSPPLFPLFLLSSPLPPLLPPSSSTPPPPPPPSPASSSPLPSGEAGRSEARVSRLRLYPCQKSLGECWNHSVPSQACGVGRSHQQCLSRGGSHNPQISTASQSCTTQRSGVR